MREKGRAVAVSATNDTPIYDLLFAQIEREERAAREKVKESAAKHREELAAYQEKCRTEYRAELAAIAARMKKYDEANREKIAEWEKNRREQKREKNLTS
ncbi:hypothetical protein FACS1894139_04350 [Planctomycetales bacterium]|nr:hypothetical protein FACS1894107_02010 [Planctomycetales bacterium]GHS99208.1 hypothetical protein FACS1894108_08760 [Planctomycetales bacterium]GHT03632.1 hypothetical protein FACS1894139_04350 [Planctomycetales bacterium]